MHLLIWLVILASLRSDWLVNYSLELQEVKYYLLIPLPSASSLHCNSNLSSFAMEVFLSVRRFCIFTWECISGMQGLFKVLQMEPWWGERSGKNVKDPGHLRGPFLQPAAPRPPWNSSFFILQASIQSEAIRFSVHLFWHWAWLCQGEDVKLVAQPRGSIRDPHSTPSPGSCPAGSWGDFQGFVSLSPWMSMVCSEGPTFTGLLLWQWRMKLGLDSGPGSGYSTNSVFSSLTYCKLETGTCPHLPSASTQTESWATAAADPQHTLSRAQGGDQGWGALCPGKTGRTGLQTHILGDFMSPILASPCI